jgi:hypothetical protein
MEKMRRLCKQMDCTDEEIHCICSAFTRYCIESHHFSCSLFLSDRAPNSPFSCVFPLTGASVYSRLVLCLLARSSLLLVLNNNRNKGEGWRSAQVINMMYSLLIVLLIAILALLFALHTHTLSLSLAHTHTIYFTALFTSCSGHEAWP